MPSDSFFLKPLTTALERLFVAVRGLAPGTL